MADEPEIQEEELEEPEPRSRSSLVIWLVALGIAALFVPLYLVSVAVEESIVPLQERFDALQETLTAPPRVPPEEVALTDRLLDLRSQLSALSDVPATLIAGHTDWPRIMAAVHSYDANRIRLTGFVHENTRLTLQGNAVEESAVLEFSDVLQDTGLFARVSVQTISLGPTPTPAREPTPQGGDPLLVELSMPFQFTLSVDLMRTADGSL